MSTGTTILRLVNVEEVERYYLQSEMLKLAHKLGWEVGDGSVELLSRGELWPLSLAQSWFNQGYTGEFLGRADFEWFEATCPVSAITFVETDQSVDTTVSSVQHNVTPAEFETGVKRWRKEHRPDHEPLLLKHVIVRQRGDEILLLDGTHRFLRQVAEGADEVLCYYGRSTGKGKRLTVIGPQIRWLRDLWRTADDEGGVQEAILTMTKHLVAISRNGAMAVEIFWIMYGREPKTRAAGRVLLGRDPAGPDRRYNPATGRFEWPEEPGKH